jgi:hypothetical protein
MQLRRDRRELGVQLGAKTIYDRDNRDRDTSGDQAILNRGRARLVGQKLPELCNHVAQYQAGE